MFLISSRFGVVLASVLISISAFAEKVLLISDIDDTIKVSHVLSTVGIISRASDVTTPFRGMSDLYKKIVRENKDQIKVVYLSNAPKEIAGIPALQFSHQTFLNYNEFPKGELNLRASLFEKNHKLKEIRRLIEKEEPAIVILVGDNGEKDVDVYHQITQEYAYLQIQMHTFIHQLYNSEVPFYLPNSLAEKGRKLYPEQNGFVTPIEISLKLNELGLLSEKSLSQMITQIAPEIVNESSFKWDGLHPITFPGFKACADFKWIFSRSSELQILINKIEMQCN